MKLGDIKVNKFEMYFGKRNKNLLDEGGAGHLSRQNNISKDSEEKKWWVYLGFGETRTA